LRVLSVRTDSRIVRRLGTTRGTPRAFLRRGSVRLRTILRCSRGSWTIPDRPSWTLQYVLRSTCMLLSVLTRAPVNAEVSGGGFPGWLSRTSDILRTNETGYLEATHNYVENIGMIIAKAQITNGGPVIAFQAENEYTFGMPWVEWPDVKYIDAVNQQFRDTGIVVPFSMFVSARSNLDHLLTRASQQ